MNSYTCIQAGKLAPGPASVTFTHETHQKEHSIAFGVSKVAPQGGVKVAPLRRREGRPSRRCEGCSLEVERAQWITIVEPLITTDSSQRTVWITRVQSKNCHKDHTRLVKELFGSHALMTCARDEDGHIWITQVRRASTFHSRHCSLTRGR
jgi:hypothetical protein